MKVGIDGMYSFTRVRNNNDLRHYGAGVTLDQLEGWGLKRDQIWIVNNQLSIFITNDSKQITHYAFYPPYITDLASVPKSLRGLVDNDGLRMIAPALVHDYYFATQEMSFRETNKLFWHMIRAVGGSWWLATKAWLAVASPIGYYFYKKFDINRSNYHMDNCKIINV